MAGTPTFRRSQQLHILSGKGRTREMAQRWLSIALLLLPFGFIFSSSAIAQNNVVGQWSSVMTWPYEAIHAHLLPTGKVLFWTRADHSQLWDPASNTVTSTAASGANIFCSGHAFLPDGTLLVAGGHVSNWVGLANAYKFNPSTGTWTRLPDMNGGRWYPTNTNLPNGDVLSISGWIDTTQGVNVEPQVWQTPGAI
jgi:galactose oxidase